DGELGAKKLEERLRREVRFAPGACGYDSCLRPEMSEGHPIVLYVPDEDGRAKDAGDAEREIRRRPLQPWTRARRHAEIPAHAGHDEQHGILAEDTASQCQGEDDPPASRGGRIAANRPP